MNDFFYISRLDEYNKVLPRKNTCDIYKDLSREDISLILWEKEKKILKSLHKNFVNKPAITHYPFPVLINSIDEKFTMKLSYCGEDISSQNEDKKVKEMLSNKYWKTKNYGHRKLLLRSLLKNKPINTEETFECIINNLVLNNIAYPDGNCFANICVNEKGHLHLVDFGPPADIQINENSPLNWRSHQQTIKGSNPGDFSKKQEHVIIKDKVELKRKTEDRFRKIQPKILETSKHK
jgi:hypothetical protein|tara:strand:- start:310 stop:1017 length:708 start_codon:yes stop_codon:yes gene_type:complete